MPSTWTTNLPQGTTKIRMLPNICQDRWTNIQQGQVPSTKWQLERRAGNPGAIANSGLIFTKDGGAATSELFYKDDAGTSNTTQLTTAGGIGAPAQIVNGSTFITLKSDLVTTYTNTQDGFCTAWGLVTGAGAIVQSYGINTGLNARTAQGEYTVTFTTPFASGATYIVVATAFDNSGSHNRVAMVRSQAAASFRVLTSSTAGSSGSYVDVQWQFAVFGGRT